MIDGKRWATARRAWVGGGGGSHFCLVFIVWGIVMFCLGTRASHTLDNCCATSPALLMVFFFKTQYHCVVLEMLVLLPQSPT